MFTTVEVMNQVEVISEIVDTPTKFSQTIVLSSAIVPSQLATAMEPPTLDGLVKEVGIALTLLDQKCSDEHLKSISLFLDWPTVAPHLGLSETNIQDIEFDTRTWPEKRLKMLQKWKRKYAYMATYKSLVQGLLKVDNADHAEQVCRLLQPPQQVHTGDSSDSEAATASATPSNQPLGGSPLATTRPIKQLLRTATTPSDQPPALATTEPTKQLPSATKIPIDQPQGIPVTGSEASATPSNQPLGGSPLATTRPIKQLLRTATTPSDQPHDTPVTTSEQPPSTTAEAATITTESLEKNIDEEIQELEDQFFTVMYKAAQDLETVDLLKVKLCVTQLPASTEYPRIKFPPEIRTAINDAKNVQEIFSILAPYWDYLNCGLLDVIVHRLGNDDTKQLMKQYMKKLKEFRMKTKVGDYIGKQAQRQSNHTTEFTMKMGDDWRVHTLQDLEEFRIELARLMQMEQYVLQYIQFKPGSILVTWAILSSEPGIADTSLQDIFPQLKKKYDVLTVVFEGKHIPEPSELAPQEGQSLRAPDDIKKLTEDYGYCVHEQDWKFVVTYQCNHKIAMCEQCYEKYEQSCPFHPEKRISYFHFFHERE